MKCFEYAQADDLRTRAEAYLTGDKAADCLSEIENLDDKLRVEKKRGRKQDLRQQRNAMKDKTNNLFNRSAELFLSIGLLRQAAQCYFSSEEYKLSARTFEDAGLFAQAGEAYYKMEDYKMAAKMFAKGNLVRKAISCYEAQKDWEMILKCIKENETNLSDEERQALINKYVPKALDAVYSMYTGEQEEEGLSSEEEKDEKEDSIGS